MQQPAERRVAAVQALAMIGVDVLAEQRDLADAGLGEPLGLGDDLRNRPRNLGAARIGHDAEGAELVAAFLHGDEGRHAALADRRAAGRARRSNLSSTGNSVSTTLPCSARAEQVGQPVIALRADHEIDRRRAAQDFLAFGLGDAAGDRDRQAASARRGVILQYAHAAELGIDLLGRLLADMAGIEDDQIGIVRHRGLGKTLGASISAIRWES